MSICIRMGVGSFGGYTRQSILHCGISDSAGKVYHFDEYGYHESRWQESVSVRLRTLVCDTLKQSKERNTEGTEAQGKAWDLKVSSFHSNRKCNSKKSEYNAIVNNCYDYVTEFLNFVEWNGHSKHTKEAIIKGWLEPCILHVEDYLQMWRQATQLSL